MASRRALEGVQVMGVRSAGRRRRAGDAGATGALLTIGSDRTDAHYACQSGRADVLHAWAGKECEIPNFGGSYLGRFPLVSANFWTSDHLSERSRRVDAFSGTIARGTLT